MTDNELNELKEIRDNAPEGATHVDRENGYLQFDGFGDSQNVDGQRYLVNVFDLPNTRSLSDINTIIELEQQKRELVKSSDWINVRDELPEKNSEGHALIYRPESYEKQGCKTQIVPMRMVSKMVDATHWMVAPTPQKDLTND